MTVRARCLLYTCIGNTIRLRQSRKARHLCYHMGGKHRTGQINWHVKEKCYSSHSVVFINKSFLYKIADNGFYVQTRILHLNNLKQTERPYSKSPMQISTCIARTLRTGVGKSRMPQINSTTSANSAMNSGSNSLTHSGRGRPVL